MIKTLLGFGLAAVAAAFASSTASAQEFRLNFGHYLSNSPFVKVEQDFAKRVEERTDGRVKINIVYSGGLGKDSELLGLVGRGAIDMAAIVPGYYGDQLVYSKALQTPFVFSSPAQAIEIANYSFSELQPFKDEMERLGVHRLFHQPVDPYYLTGKTDACKSLDGLQGKKIRTFGSLIPHMMSAVGATPVTVPAGDLYEAVDRGTIDYSFVNLGNVNVYRLYEAGKFTCGPAMNIAGHLVVIGDRTWQRLPDDIKTIITEESVQAQKDYVAFVESSVATSSEAIKAGGGEIIAISPEMLAEWKEKTPDLLQMWVDELKGRGEGEGAAAVAQAWRERVDQ
ncbi:TRAP transporter substrate-binding protein DctP [Tianweitania sp. BSSL-BM11]|uniref:TRAP transporter substrate-binding protein DctP n=1 Tax=Tianweitania aestuarii TaxID=2814886 RepID=A0ABS5RXP3_9HYPH|nr:TRAP transporter substrate-binding protein DctP [Tianweitania aestuarii]MBS9721809.1 TRAP transporter substrate-binding protein DctP [Tianweitania aestuarii]